MIQHKCEKEADELLTTVESLGYHSCSLMWKLLGPKDIPSILQRWAIVPPSIIALIISAAMLSNKSAPRAAQSPTLSPTFNAEILKN